MDQELLDSWMDDLDPDFKPEVYLPSNLCREVVMVCGMRSSKTFMASLIGSYECYRYLSLANPWKFYNLPQHSPVYGMIAATSEQTALDTVFAQLKPLILGNPFFEACDAQVLKSSIHFPTHNLTIRVGASYSGALVGRTDLFVIFDELDQCPDTKGRLGGEAVYRALSKGTATMNGLTISLTSPLYEDSMSMRLLRGSADDPTMAGFRLPTWMINPNIPRTHPKIQSAFIKDKEGASRDYGAKPSGAIAPYFKARTKLVESFAHNNAFDGELLREDFKARPNALYCMAGDPSNKTDDFGIAFGCLTEDGVITIEGATALSPDLQNGLEIDPDDVYDLFMDIANRVDPEHALFDTYNYPKTRKDLRDRDIEVSQNHVLLPEFRLMKTLINTGMLKLPHEGKVLSNEDKLYCELKALELHKGRRIDHPTKGSKDRADAVCQCVFWLANQEYTDGEEMLPQLM